MEMKKICPMYTSVYTFAYFLFLKISVKTKQTKIHASVTPDIKNWRVMMAPCMRIWAMVGVPSGGTPSRVMQCMLVGTINTW